MTTRRVIPFLLIVQTLLLLNLNWMTSHNRTENGHIGAAVYFWTTGRFDVFCVNPPLARAICGAPIALCRPNYDWKPYSPRPQDRAEWGIGSAFIQANDESSVRLYFFLARSALIPIILLGAWFGCRFTSELYGRAAGSVFLTLWTFSPLFLGWGATICPDMTAAAMGVIGLYYFWRWLKRPDRRSVIVAGITLGLMPLTKMTWVIAFPLYLVLWGIWRAAPPKSGALSANSATPQTNALSTNNTTPQSGELSQSGHPSKPSVRQLAFILLIGLYMINMGYGFDGSFRPLEEYTFISNTLSGSGNERGGAKSGNRFAETWLGKIPVPLPADFVLGIDTQKLDFERGMPSYLNGVTSDRGWKSYYLYVLLYKEPIAAMALAAMAVMMTICRVSRRHTDGSNAPFRDEMIPVVTAAALFTFVSLQDGISIHPRYILPALPFAYIFIAKTGQLLSRRTIPPAGLAALGLAAFVVSSMAQYPHSMSYFNAIAGGPAGGPAHLLGSNADWGQSTFFLRDWCRRHPDRTLYTSILDREEIDQLGMTNVKMFPRFRPDNAPNDADPADSSEILEHGWYAVSVNDLYETDTPSPFPGQKPKERLGASILLFEVTPNGSKPKEETL